MTPHGTTSLYRLHLVREADYPYDTGTLTCSASAAKFFRPLFEGLDREQMAVAFLDAKHRVIGVGIVSIGSLTASIVHPREVFKPAIVSNAAAIIIAHYVSRHIMRVMFPASLCGKGRWPAHEFWCP